MNEAFNEAFGAKPAAEEVVSTEAAPVEQAGGGRQRDEHGRFASAASTETPAVETPPAATPEPPAQPEPQHAPITALLDEREKRQEAQRKAEALERQLAEMRSQQQPPPPLEPTEALQVALYQQNLRASRRFAEREYGKDQIAAVHEWAVRKCDEDPIFNEQMRSSEDPYEAAYQAFNRDKILAEVKPDDFAAFKAWREAQAQAASVQSAPSPQSAPAAPVPRSLATASGTGGAGQPHVPVGPGQAFASVINR
jgi:hypothetical protein